MPVIEKTTEEVVIEQLTENTGRHFLDSGSAYGRHWQRNQGRDFSKEPECIYKFERHSDGSWWLDSSVSLYHYMTNLLDFSPQMQALCDKLAELHPEDSWFELVERLRGHLIDHCKATGLYGESSVFSGNTYNSDNVLSQDFQYVYLEIPEGPLKGCYLIVQVHGGCDIRGGYSSPKCYTVDSEPYWLTALRDLEVCCERGDPDVPGQSLMPHGEPKRPHHWSSDDAGCHFYRDGCCGRGAKTQLEKYTADDLKIDEEGNAYCPECGGRLSVWANLCY